MKLYIAIAMLVGMIIGAGVLGIPYVIAQAGWKIGLINLLGLGMALLVLNLYMGEICLRTRGSHQLPGYAEHYLGKLGKVAILIGMSLQVYGALTAYLLGQGTTLASLFGGDERIYSLVFFIFAALLIWHGLKTVGKSELIITGGLVVVVTIVSIFLLLQADPSNYQGGSGILLAPYGVILFAFYGVTAIPLLKEELLTQRKQLKKAIIIGSAIPIAIYTLFAFAVLGAIGLDGFNALPIDQRIASAALQLTVNGWMGIFLDVFAFLAMASSFLASGLVMKELYHYDFKLKRVTGFFLTLSVPFLIFLFDAFVMDVANFIQIIGITGGIAGSFMGMLIVLMFHKALEEGDRHPEYSLGKHRWISGLLFILFGIGLIYQAFILIP